MTGLKKFTRNTFLIILMCITGIALGQQSANQILYNLYAKSLLVKDYSVDARIRVDLPFIKMLPVDAQVYFKQQDKFRVKSKSIAVLPKQGFSDFAKMIKDTNSYTAIITGKENIKTYQTTIINIIPSADTSDLILGKLWVDEAKKLIIKSQLTTKSNGTILVEYIFNSQLSYGLPDSMIFTIDVKKFKIPKGVASDINNNSSKPQDNTKDPKKGRIFITLRNYRINQGLPDSVFKD